jgi:hypothetical protein
MSFIPVVSKKEGIQLRKTAEIFEKNRKGFINQQIANRTGISLQDLESQRAAKPITSILNSVLEDHNGTKVVRTKDVNGKSDTTITVAPITAPQTPSSSFSSTVFVPPAPAPPPITKSVFLPPAPSSPQKPSISPNLLAGITGGVKLKKTEKTKAAPKKQLLSEEQLKNTKGKLKAVETEDKSSGLVGKVVDIEKPPEIPQLKVEPLNFDPSLFDVNFENGRWKRATKKVLGYINHFGVGFPNNLIVSNGDFSALESKINEISSAPFNTITKNAVVNPLKEFLKTKKAEYEDELNKNFIIHGSGLIHRESLKNGHLVIYNRGGELITKMPASKGLHYLLTKVGVRKGQAGKSYTQQDLKNYIGLSKDLGAKLRQSVREMTQPESDVFYYKNPEDLLSRLDVLKGEIQAGNTNPEVRNQSMTIVDLLLKNRIISKKEHKQLFDEIVL